MADTLFLELVSPEKALVSKEVDEILALGVDGEFGLLPGHSPFCTELKMGGLTFKSGNETITVVMQRGFLEVSDDKVVVLAEKAEFSSDIDVEEAKSLRDEAAQVMEQTKLDGGDEYKSAEIAYAYHTVRIDYANK